MVKLWNTHWILILGFIKMNINECLKIINNIGGKFFSLRFIKKDGSIREINCRLGVHTHVKGTGASYDPAKFGMITVYDVKHKGYRNVTINKIIGIKLNNEWHHVEHNNIPTIEQTCKSNEPIKETNNGEQTIPLGEETKEIG